MYYTLYKRLQKRLDRPSRPDIIIRLEDLIFSVMIPFVGGMLFSSIFPSVIALLGLDQPIFVLCCMGVAYLYILLMSLRESSRRIK